MQRNSPRHTRGSHHVHLLVCLKIYQISVLQDEHNASLLIL